MNNFRKISYKMNIYYKFRINKIRTTISDINSSFSIFSNLFLAFERIKLNFILITTSLYFFLLYIYFKLQHRNNYKIKISKSPCPSCARDTNERRRSMPRCMPAQKFYCEKCERSRIGTWNDDRPRLLHIIKTGTS